MFLHYKGAGLGENLLLQNFSAFSGLFMVYSLSLLLCMYQLMHCSIIIDKPYYIAEYLCYIIRYYLPMVSISYMYVIGCGERDHFMLNVIFCLCSIRYQFQHPRLLNLYILVDSMSEATPGF